MGSEDPEGFTSQKGLWSRTAHRRDVSLRRVHVKGVRPREEGEVYRLVYGGGVPTKVTRGATHVCGIMCAHFLGLETVWRIIVRINVPSVHTNKSKYERGYDQTLGALLLLVSRKPEMT